MPTTRMQQRSVPEVLQDIIGNMEEIIRSELRLAKAEIKDEAAKAAKPGTTLGIGLVLGFYGLGFVLLAAVYALSSVVTTWMAALIVGAGLAVVASARPQATKPSGVIICTKPSSSVKCLRSSAASKFLE